MKTPHTSCARGTRVRVVLRTGEVIVAKFLERTGKFVLLEGHRLRGADIKNFGIKR